MAKEMNWNSHILKCNLTSHINKISDTATEIDFKKIKKQTEK